MPDFAPVITDYWAAAFSGKPLHNNEYLTITANPDLDDNERVTILRTADDDRVSIAVSPQSPMHWPKTLPRSAIRQRPTSGPRWPPKASY
ncbi:hypothetical protein [Mycolicibacterium llatzerense]|uniref:hypothetical protein n=1 Tax=Mycolicibacterium llatzerense TaxID=280871 RepID=UPI0009F2FD7E|nr:hypothetical protein [Mycolicibacterium llatzerense]